MYKIRYFQEPNCEVWNCCWIKNNCCASGSEDTQLKIWDLRSDCQKPIQLNKSHESGIVFLEQFAANQIISGSYDESIRIFDLRNINDPLDSVKVC